ncbi:PepSY-like domain-containing protein [Flavisolibacter ginsenosidimutans]|nr:PepSY-like domain-containing protein [Flavisolibacter ginsenosidimutans]
MKTPFKRAFLAIASATLLFTACKKSDLTQTGSSSTSNTIAVAASLTSSTASTSSTTQDSVYLVQPCGRGGRRDSVAQSSLPSAVGSYLSANYSGYTFSKAFAVKDASGNTTGYVVVIYYNNTPVGLQFDSAGAFVKVLEQREKGDLDGAGWHHGGRFEHRDGQQRDSIALSALPSSITAYFAANYATDTLVKAFRDRDSSIVVLSKNNGAFATVFTASGSFVKRIQLHDSTGSAQAIDLSALPSTAANYLSTTYPNYVFEKAFSVSQNGALKGYVVFIDANNTKYAVEFDATGNFLHAKTIH